MQGRYVQVAKGGAPLEIVMRDVPEPKTREVRVRIEACGVCHSDSVTVQGLFPFITYPRVPGHEVIGVTLQLYDHGAAVGRKGACCAGQDIHDAKRVADRLGIAHYVIDAEARFRGSVISAFADSYASGQTPVPCIACNQHLKFGDLLGMARDLGAEAMATGRIETFDLTRAIYYTGHETIIPSGRRPGLPRWREALFAFLHHNAQRPGAFFKIPGSQIMEIGVEFEI